MLRETREEQGCLVLWASGMTHMGLKRANNEDGFIVMEIKDAKDKTSKLLCAVADGMGGQDFGELASLAALRTLSREAGKINKFPSDMEWMRHSVVKANQEINDEAARLKPGKGMGSTLVCMLFSGESCLIANVGDSRAYLMRDGTIRRLTKDHSLVELMIDKELISPEEAYTHPRRGELTHFLGQADDVAADLFRVEVRSGDVLLLCSDGLWEMVRDNEIADILGSAIDPREAVQQLIEAANQAGGVDNITAVVVKAESHLGGRKAW